MELTQEQINTLALNLRKKQIKLEILDTDFHTLYSAEGNAISGNITFSADNDLRRSGDITIALPTNANSQELIEQLDGYMVKYNGKIWLDKRFKISIGIVYNNSVIWYNMGIYLINEPKITLNENQYEMNFQCIDLMARFMENRGGQLTGSGYVIPIGEYITEDGETTFVKNEIKDVFIKVLKELGGVNNIRIYPIPEINKYIPYELKFNVGVTIYDILSTLLSLLPVWQMYFDNNGTFVIEPIFSGANASIYPINREQYLGQEISYDFENVRNQIVIYGRVNSLNYFTKNTDEIATNVVYDTTNHKLILQYDKEINTNTITISGTKFGFLSLSNTNTNYINKIEIWHTVDSVMTKLIESNLVKFENVTNSFGVNYATTQIEIGAIPQNQVCFINVYSATLDNNNKVVLDNNTIFQFCGKQEVSYTLANDNKESPFYVNNNYEQTNFYCGTALTDTNFNLGENYKLILNDTDNTVSSLENNTILTFMANGVNTYKSGQNFTSINVYSSNGTQLLSNIPLTQNIFSGTTRPYLQENKISNDYTILEIRYDSTRNEFVFNGRNKNVYTLILSDGEYSNLKADELAYQRCVKELYDHSNMQDNTMLYMIPDYLINVNYKIPYYEKDAYPKNVYVEDDNVLYFMTKQITYPLGVNNTKQTIYAIRVYDGDNLITNGGN